MAEIRHPADYVFYQSRVCKESADRFPGERSHAWEILYNPVDTDCFSPTTLKPISGPLVPPAVPAVSSMFIV